MLILCLFGGVFSSRYDPGGRFGPWWPNWFLRICTIDWRTRRITRVWRRTIISIERNWSFTSLIFVAISFDEFFNRWILFKFQHEMIMLSQSLCRRKLMNEQNEHLWKFCTFQTHICTNLCKNKVLFRKENYACQNKAKQIISHLSHRNNFSSFINYIEISLCLKSNFPNLSKNLKCIKRSQ